MFIGPVLEGEIVMLSAGVLAYLGVLNIWSLFWLARSGALGDNIWFWIGRRVGKPFIHKYGAYLAMNVRHVARTKAYLAAASLLPSHASCSAQKF